MSPDPITIEILRNAFIMAAEEMNAALIRLGLHAGDI